MDKIFELIRNERAHQDAKWGANRKLAASTWFVILGREFGEVGRAILKRDPINLIEELVHLAAVTVAILEAIYDGRTGQF